MNIYGRAMNIYEYDFSASCPNDGESIKYRLEIECEEMIMAEHIVEICNQAHGYQENIAKELKQKISGNIKLIGTHSGVRITTLL